MTTSKRETPPPGVGFLNSLKKHVALFLLCTTTAVCAQISYGTYTFETRTTTSTAHADDIIQWPVIFWSYTGFYRIPAGPLTLYPALECNVMSRNIINFPVSFSSNRFILAGAPFVLQLINNPNQQSFIFVEPGIATPLTLLTRNAFFCHAIADYRFISSDRLTVGIGILVSYNNGAFKTPPVNLLPYLDWKAGNNFSVEIKWDHLSLVYGLTPKLKIRSETRYDLMFSALSDTCAYQWETVGAGLGLGWQFGKRTVIDMYTGYQFYSKEQLKMNGFETALVRHPGGIAIRGAIRY
jgi:hypothetical protein